jgi:hypothetical protein
MAERPMGSFPTPKVRFLGELDGVPEQEFKRRILGVLSASHTQEAYLANVDYEGAEGPITAVCLVGNSKEAEHVCGTIAGIFTHMFRESSALDMMYITREQRLELALVCRPFYLHKDSAQA